MVDESTPIPVEAAREAASNLFAIILSSMERMEAALGRTQSSVDNNTARMDTLIDTTNHRLDDFHAEMVRREEKDMSTHEEFQNAVIAMVAMKANKTELVTDVFRKNRSVQIVTAAAIIAMAPVVFDHWDLLFKSVQGIFS